MNIERLVDYPSIKKLAAALWQESHHLQGAAVLIGAGFSRSAAKSHGSNKKMPLWWELCQHLENDLGSTNNHDPLRLAEEYYSYFGKQGLYDVIKNHINDPSWHPSDLHHSLLKLPWTEVLTTNWDSLLERASHEIYQPIYSVVTKQYELASTRSPRIVKLHGTINVTDDLIFTQEDFRRYPEKHAAFVNFTRQVFIENELCLLGFSGDDPNFLQWSGWVRDHLASNSRRIYLVGALNLTASKRKYLESINIAPIDLWNLVENYDDADLRHQKASEFFLQHLLSLKSKPIQDWSPEQASRSTQLSDDYQRLHSDHVYAATCLEQQIPVLEHYHQTYPNWIICPEKMYWKIKNQLTAPYPSLENISKLSKENQEIILHEIAWKHSITNEVISPWVLDFFIKLCKSRKPCALTKKQLLQTSLIFLKNIRWLEESEETIEKKNFLIEVINKNSDYFEDSRNEALYLKAIEARDSLDYTELENITKDICADFPVWKIRKASLLMELGRYDQAHFLILEANKILIKHHRDNAPSIDTISKLAWTQFLIKDIEEHDSNLHIDTIDFKRYLCDPLTIIDSLDRKISERIEKQNISKSVVPVFQAGHFKDNSNTIHFNSEQHPLLRLDLIMNHVGIPLRGKKHAFITKTVKKITELHGLDDIHKITLIARAANSESCAEIEQIFSRFQISKYSEKTIESLNEQCKRSISFWIEKHEKGSVDQKEYSIDRLRVFFEILARIQIRSSTEKALLTFSFAIGIVKKISHWWLIKPYKNLIEYTLESIPKNEQQNLLFDVLDFPLSTEVHFPNIRSHTEWPNPIIENINNRDFSDSRINHRIQTLIRFSSKDNKKEAILRLMPLARNGLLSIEESDQLANIFWGSQPFEIVFSSLEIYASAIYTLPSPSPETTRSNIEKYLFDTAPETLNSNNRLIEDLAFCSQNSKKELKPSEEQAIVYFNQLTSWRPPQTDEDDFMININQSEYKRKSKYIGKALALSIIPQLPKKFLTQENFGRLYVFYQETESYHAIVGFPYFYKEASDIIERAIRQGLQNTDPNHVACAAHAILEWEKIFPQSDNTQMLITNLVYTIGMGRLTGLSALLWTATELLKLQSVNERDIKFLRESCLSIFGATNYESIVGFSREISSIPMIRQQCVMLAKELISIDPDINAVLNEVINTAKIDALPEVRFAALE